MYLLGLGLIFLAMKYLEVDPVAGWSWVVVLAPFGLAMAWWAWADASGYTKKKAMQRMEQKRIDRINRSKDAIGTLNSRDKKKKR